MKKVFNTGLFDRKKNQRRKIKILNGFYPNSK